MPALIVLIPNKENLEFPPIWEALRVLRTAQRLGCDRIRVESAGGVRIQEFPLDTVRYFARKFQIHLQPTERRLREDRGDLERHQPVWAMRRMAAKETI